MGLMPGKKRREERTEHHQRGDLNPALVENGCRVEAVSKRDGQMRPATVCIELDECVCASVARGGMLITERITVDQLRDLQF